MAALSRTQLGNEPKQQTHRLQLSVLINLHVGPSKDRGLVRTRSHVEYHTLPIFFALE
jgi:hypothetical protein